MTIDPENNAVYTSTYFTELDDYLDSARGDGELDRDGLTGECLGHEETLEFYVGPPEVVAIAKAGNDQFVTAESGQEKALATLDGDWTLNPASDEELTYNWTDADGNVVATTATPTLELGAGHHNLTLTVTDSAGRISMDEILVVVANENTLLVDNFNDGNADGWGRPGPTIPLSTGTTADFQIAQLPTPAAPDNDDFVRVANFHKETIRALGELVAAAGLEHPHQLSPHHFMRRIAPDRIVTFAELYKFLQPGELLSGNISDERMRAAWAIARADSFTPVAASLQAA